MGIVNCKQRLERLERDYFPHRDMRGMYLYELNFMVEFHKQYGEGDSAPPFLRNAVKRISERSVRSRSRIAEPKAATDPKTPIDPAGVTPQEPGGSGGTRLDREGLRRF
jgi:hypothetical protein